MWGPGEIPLQSHIMSLGHVFVEKRGCNANPMMIQFQCLELLSFICEKKIVWWLDHFSLYTSHSCAMAKGPALWKNSFNYYEFPKSYNTPYSHFQIWDSDIWYFYGQEVTSYGAGFINSHHLNKEINIYKRITIIITN